MIVLDENNKPLIDPDLSKGQITEETRSVFHRYIVDSEAVTHEEVVAEYPNGGKDVAIVIDVPEQGHWETCLESGELIEFSGDIPDDAPHDTVLEDHEPILRYHPTGSIESATIKPRVAADQAHQPTIRHAAATDEGGPSTTGSSSSIAQWARAAAVRALKTAAQALVTLIGADMVSIVALDWSQMFGVAATMAVVSLLTSVAGIPEVDEGTNVASLARNN